MHAKASTNFVMSAKKQTPLSKVEHGDETPGTWDDSEAESSSVVEKNKQNSLNINHEYLNTEISSDEASAEDDCVVDILESYRRLLPRRVDLVGDYAGDVCIQLRIHPAKGVC